jgi:hypothetical protein
VPLDDRQTKNVAILQEFQETHTIGEISANFLPVVTDSYFSGLEELK